MCGLQPTLDEDPFLMCRSCRSVREKKVQLVEISLGQVAGADTVTIFYGDRDDAALFVLSDRSAPRKLLGCVDAITFVIDLLELEAFNEVIADRAALDEVDVQCCRVSCAE